jgi:hypothetical protein
MKEMWALALLDRDAYGTTGEKMVARFESDLRMLLSEFSKARPGFPS